jgi:hypothetical protein
MPECLTVRHPVTTPVPEGTKMPVPERVRYSKKVTQSDTGVLWYWTEIPDAGMSMPAASTSMPMPNCAEYVFLKKTVHLRIPKIKL